MKNKILILALLAAVLIFPAFSQNTADSKVELITENRQLPTFLGIEVTGRFRVVLYESATQQVSVTAPDKFFESVETTVDKGVLRIKMKDTSKDSDANLLENLKTRYNDYLIRQPIEVNIGVPNLQIIAMSGASRLETKGVVNFENLTVDLSGASRAELNLNIVENLIVALAEAVKFDIQGKTTNLTVKANGACAFNGANLNSKNAKVELNGASRAELHATESLDANLNGATKLVCTGSPKSLKESASRGSSITVK